MKKLIGGICLAIGILIAGASGLCSLVVLFNGSDGLSYLPLVLLVGGIPFLLGIGVAFIGRAILRSDASP